MYATCTTIGCQKSVCDSHRIKRRSFEVNVCSIKGQNQFPLEFYKALVYILTRSLLMSTTCPNSNQFFFASDVLLCDNFTFIVLQKHRTLIKPEYNEWKLSIMLTKPPSSCSRTSLYDTPTNLQSTILLYN